MLRQKKEKEVRSCSRSGGVWNGKWGCGCLELRSVHFLKAGLGDSPSGDACT
jgi:hypothetical protein